ncbi:MAG: hypothetical protein HFG40_02840 [Bacilli bacterium]|nr:hypothetical protein [Bacilli bacterium]
MSILECSQLQTEVEKMINDLDHKKKSCAIIAREEVKIATAIKMIINFSKEDVLFCAPTESAIQKIKDTFENMGYDLMRDFKNLQFYTFDQLHSMIKNVKRPEYSLLICDQFHLLNKKKQYQSIKQLFKDSKNKKYFGLSQTPLSNWEYERIYEQKLKSGKRIENITESLYENNISFFYSIEDAIIDGLIDTPVYNEYFILEGKKPRQIALELLRQARTKNVTEEMIDSLIAYLSQESSLVDILEKYIQPEGSRIMYICKDFQDLIEKEQLLKEIFPQLSIYKTAAQLDKKENDKNVEHFLNTEFSEGNSKVLLSLKQEIEATSIDGKVQIIFGTKTNSYKDFIQKLTQIFVLGKNQDLEVLDLGGDLTRIRSLDFFEFKYKLERKAKKRGIASKDFPKIKYNGNMPALNDMVKEMAKNTFVSKKEKAEIYYDRITSNFGILKNPDETFRDETSFKDWEKEMTKIASTELHLLQENPEYQISEENMYIIETAAYIDSLFEIPKTESEESKRQEYYKKAILCKNILLKNELLRFSDGTYMSTWYQTQRRKVETILNKIEKNNDYELKEDEMLLLVWMNKLHTALKALWVERILRAQRKEQNSELNKKWRKISELVADNPSLLKTKKDWDSLEKFNIIEEFYNEVEMNTLAVADINFPYANRISIERENEGKKIVLKTINQK